MLASHDILGSPFVGVYLAVGGDVVLTPPGLTDNLIAELEKALGRTAVATTIGGTTVVGSLAVGNANGMVVSDVVTPGEFETLRSAGLDVTVLPGKYNALGNLFLVNDHGGVAHPGTPRHLVTRVGKALGVRVAAVDISGARTPGSAALANNKGCLVHPKASTEAIEAVAAALNVDVRTGTLNYGSPYLGSAAVATDAGAVTGTTSTGPELNRLEDTLDLID